MFLDFEFAGEMASDHGLVVGSFQSSDIEIVPSGAELTFTQLKPARKDTFQLYSADYQEPYTATFQVMKHPCNCHNTHDLYFTPEEYSSIQRWLCRKSSYHKFKINDDGFLNIYWMVVFHTKQILSEGRIVGLELTLYADAPYAYSEPVCLEFDCTKDVPFHVYDTSDEEGAIHPSMEIHFTDASIDSSGFTFTLSNSMDAKIMKIHGCSKNEIIKIDGKNLMIHSSNTAHISLAKDFNYFFPKIINQYKNNDNIFTANVNCTIRFLYAPIRKAGLP